MSVLWIFSLLPCISVGGFQELPVFPDYDRSSKSSERPLKIYSFILVSYIFAGWNKSWQSELFCFVILIPAVLAVIRLILTIFPSFPCTSLYFLQTFLPKTNILLFIYYLEIFLLILRTSFSLLNWSLSSVNEILKFSTYACRVAPALTLKCQSLRKQLHIN